MTNLGNEEEIYAAGHGSGRTGLKKHLPLLFSYLDVLFICV